MPSTFFGLNIGYTGLQAASTALNVTGNNIANVETEGYTRQETVQSAANALRTNTTYGMAGSGVDTTAIKQIRESYYDLKYWQNNASLGIYEIKQQYYRQIEDYFTDTDDVMGFNVIFGDLFDSLDEVYKSSGDDTKKNAFLSECTTLCEYFNSMSTNLKKLQTDANNEILNKVNEINALASEIATLNKQINTIEINGPVANELRDKRALLVDQLSVIADVEVQEISIPISEGSSEPSGIYRYIVNIAGGQNLVNGYDYSTLTCEARSESQKVNQSDADGLFDIYINDISLNLYGGSLGGELKGLLEIRDGNNGEAFSEKAKNVTIGDDAETGKGTKVTIAIDPANENYKFLTDMNKTTLNAAGTITIGNKNFEYLYWEYDADAEEYTFYLKEDASEYAGKDVIVGKDIEYQGIPYYQAQLNEWVRSFSQAMNKIELNAQDAQGNQTEVLFSAGTENYKYSDYYLTDTAGNYVRDAEGNVQAQKITSTKTGSDNNYALLTAGNFRVNKTMTDDITKLGTTSDITQGQDAQDITLELLKVRTDKSKMTYRGCTSSEFLQCLTADVALGASSANNFYNNFSKISDSIIAQRTSVSGVDNDEEALNLVKFQEAFNLSSKMIQIMTEVYDRLILQTGV